MIPNCTEKCCSGNLHFDPLVLLVNVVLIRMYKQVRHGIAVGAHVTVSHDSKQRSHAPNAPPIDALHNDIVLEAVPIVASIQFYPCDQNRSFERSPSRAEGGDDSDVKSFKAIGMCTNALSSLELKSAVRSKSTSSGTRSLLMSQGADEGIQVVPCYTTSTAGNQCIMKLPKVSSRELSTELDDDDRHTARIWPRYWTNSHCGSSGTPPSDDAPTTGFWTPRSQSPFSSTIAHFISETASVPKIEPESEIVDWESRNDADINVDDHILDDNLDNCLLYDAHVRIRLRFLYTMHVAHNDLNTLCDYDVKCMLCSEIRNESVHERWSRISWIARNRRDINSLSRKTRCASMV